MRFGCCLNMVATNPDGTGVEYIEKLAQYGFDYVELPLAEMMELSDQEFETLRKRVEKSGVKCEVCNNFFPKYFRLTGEQVDMDSIMQYVKKALARASQLGVQYVVFGSGPAKNVPQGFPMNMGYAQVVALLKEVNPIAAQNGITIVIEPLRKAECNLINTFLDGCQLAKDADGSNIRVLVDFYHLTEENEPLEHILDSGKEYLKHVHFARPEGRVYPEKMDEAGYLEFINALKAVSYDARISCEAYTDNFEMAAPKALEFFKQNFN